MKVTWLTQAGLVFENENATVMVDPALSHFEKLKREDREVKITPDESFIEKQPDIILITHEHDGHLDLETIERIIASCEHPITFISPKNAYAKLKKLGGRHNYVMLNPHSVWSERGITFYAVHAEHPDPAAVGFIMDDGERTFYISGDTLYNYDVIDEVLELVEDGVDYAFLPINGRGNNMNAKDAADFAYEIDAKIAVPVHYGLFDSVNPESFDFDDVLILEPYRELEI